MHQILFGNSEKDPTFQTQDKHVLGFIFLEILVSISLISLVFITIIGIAFLSLNISYSLERTAQINSFIRESMEATRAVRDGTVWGTNGLGSLSTGSANPYRVVLDSSSNPPAWKLELGTESIGSFTRKIVFDKVSRDPSTQNIETTYNASHDDPNTRKVTVTVSFDGKDYQAVTYFTNWQQ